MKEHQADVVNKKSEEKIIELLEYICKGRQAFTKSGGSNNKSKRKQHG